MMLKRNQLGILTVFFLSHISGDGFGRPYKYYLNANRAEEILAGIAMGPRLGNEDWLKLIKYQRNDTHAIQSGDNLWRIAKNKFGNPFLWRKIWQENPWITNPHDLDVGRVLAYYREQADNTIIKKIPIIKLRPASAGQLSDVDNDVVINRVLRTRHRITYYVFQDEEFIGEISGAYAEKKMVRETDEVYAMIFEDSKVKVGDKFAVVREEKVLRDRTIAGNPVIGRLMHLVGEIQIERKGENLVKVELLSLAAPMHRGDKLVPVLKIVADSNAENPPRSLVSRIVMGEDPETRLFRQGSLVVVNKGTEDGMKDGFLFKAYKDTDPHTDSREGVEPASKGEVRIVYSGKLSSIGYIIRNSDPLMIGDTLIAGNALPDLPPPPQRIYQQLEVD